MEKVVSCKASDFTKCSGRQESREYCLKHYQQVKKHGKVFVTRFDRRPAIVDSDTAKIPLGVNAKDGYAIVDIEYSWVDQHNWSKSSVGYAQARVNGKLVLMHRLIMGDKDGFEIDHINLDRLDNRKANLRHVTHGENMYNLPLAKNNKSGIRGVDWDSRKNKWRAQIQFQSKNRFIGYFDSKVEAHRARKAKEKELYLYTNGTIIPGWRRV